MLCQRYKFNVQRDFPDPVIAVPVPVRLVGSRRGPVLMFLGLLRRIRVQIGDWDMADVEPYN